MRVVLSKEEIMKMATDYMRESSEMNMVATDIEFFGSPACSLVIIFADGEKYRKESK